jgi:hypothetical protein
MSVGADPAKLAERFKKGHRDINELRAGRRTEHMSLRPHRSIDVGSIAFTIMGCIIPFVLWWLGYNLFEQFVASTLCFAVAQLCEINARLKEGGADGSAG